MSLTQFARMRFLTAGQNIYDAGIKCYNHDNRRRMWLLVF